MRNAALASASILSLALAAAAAGEDFKEVRKTIPLDPDGRVVIETFKGSIDVETWDRPEVGVAARVEPDENGRHQAEKVRETEVRIEGSGRRVRIESDYDRTRHHGFLGIFGEDGTLPFVRYTIRLPRTARLEVKDFKSETRIHGLAGSLKLETYKGRVEIAGVEGSVRLRTYKGDVRVEFARFSASDFETYKGDIEIALSRLAAFDLDADLGRRGNLHSDFELATSASRRDGDGGRRRGSANGGGPALRLETYKGSFRLRAR
ncbi:MAG: DUF4097 family beta strand repeat-containing protein [Thermoanaerobaculia bacterium]